MLENTQLVLPPGWFGWIGSIPYDSLGGTMAGPDKLGAVEKIRP